jgi:hypothetical protein
MSRARIVGLGATGGRIGGRVTVEADQAVADGLDTRLIWFLTIGNLCLKSRSVISWSVLIIPGHMNRITSVDQVITTVLCHLEVEVRLIRLCRSINTKSTRVKDPFISSVNADVPLLDKRC